MLLNLFSVALFYFIEGGLCCRFCRVHHRNAAIFKFHHCANSHECKFCIRRFPTPYKLQVNNC